MAETASEIRTGATVEAVGGANDASPATASAAAAAAEEEPSAGGSLAEGHGDGLLSMAAADAARDREGPAGDGYDDEDVANASNDDEDDEDDEMLRKFRETRLAEMRLAAGGGGSSCGVADAAATSARFGGGLTMIDQQDWKREVEAASLDGTWVVVHLHESSVPACGAMVRVLETLSRAHPAVKFVRIEARYMIPPSHYRNLPAIFCYKDGQLAHRMIGNELLSESGTVPTKELLEWKLAALGVVETDLEEAPQQRLRIHRGPTTRAGGAAGRTFYGGSGGGGGGGGEEDDTDDEIDDVD